MATMTRTMITQFVQTIGDKREKMSAESRMKAKDTLSRAPMTFDTIKAVEEMEDVDFTPIATMKRQQRFEDTASALMDAESAGVTTLEEFAQWLKVPKGSQVNDIIDAAHAYGRIGKRNRPETISGFLDDIA